MVLPIISGILLLTEHCQNKSTYLFISFSVRLKSRGRTDVGTVEIRLNEGWVEVCDQGWDDQDAKVLCHDMGFKDGVAMCCSKLGVDQSDSSPNKAFTQFKCLGHEQNLFQCPNTTLRTKCASEHRASAICYSKPQSEVAMGKFLGIFIIILDITKDIQHLPTQNTTFIVYFELPNAFIGPAYLFIPRLALSLLCYRCN